MLFRDRFIKATEAYNTFEAPVPAYYFRKSYCLQESCHAKITIGVCGFYELFLNGEKITRGFLSPYISNTNDYIYCDEYDVELTAGENVFGVLLGNGFQNNPGGYIWEFDKSDFRSAPMFALTVTRDGETLFCSDDQFKIAPSPIRRDDYRFGEIYDANYEIAGWNMPEFDDSAWKNALLATPPKGELCAADVAPIVKEQERKPVEIIKCQDGYIYDFGQSNAGVCRLTVRGEKGQRIEIQHADSLKDGDLDIAEIWYLRPEFERDKHIVHKDIYICKGEGEEIYQPTFTYHGFRYGKVTGITEQQATKDLLTYLVYHTQVNTRGDFSCSDPVANALQEITRRSITSNFHHFPTDCPQREKNGWTADGALICETALLNFDPERNYREWLRNICKAQRFDGALPGIVPTGGWGFEWGNGPAWDSVLTWLPYYTFIYRGQTEMIRESADAFTKYLRYLRSRCDEKGLLSIGLGDWCPVGGGAPKAPLIVTDTILSMDIARKVSVMLDAVNMPEMADYAEAEAEKYKASIRAELLDPNTMWVQGNCQTCQAMALYYGIFTEDEEPAALNNLLQTIRDADDHIDLGVLGGRVIFHVLSRFGYGDLAYKMITREDYPSYGNWLELGATTLRERFHPTATTSKNHQFWGDISGWFIRCVAGIQLNPTGGNVNEVQICPCFVETLDSASGYHIAPAGKIAVFWRRQNNGVVLELEIPGKMTATAVLPRGYRFENGSNSMAVTTGGYNIIKE